MIRRIGLIERLAIFSLSALCFVWFYQNVYQKVLEGKTIALDDVRTRSILTLRKDFDRGDAKRIRLYLSGQIDGQAQITLSDENGFSTKQLLSPGKVSVKINQAWNAPICVLEYNPLDVGVGFLYLRYQFETKRK